MGLKSLFSKEGRKERSVAKACAKAINPKLKPDDRRPALQLLIDTGSDEAVTALLGRFEYNYDTNMVSDEEEKNFVYKGLLSLGERILPALREHLRAAETLSWGLRLATDICDKETLWQVLQGVIEHHEPGYDRDPTRKQQLISALGDYDDPRCVDALIPYLQDHDEGVRFMTVEGLLRLGDEKAREPLLDLFINEDEESLRLKNRIAEGFVQTGWVVRGYRGTVEKALGEEYHLDGKGRIKHKQKRTGGRK
ncbi:MAG: HEAT repeat domain-containing protein [Myxococcales bacterium]|nr:HEAT repeat domain-containing protein [Myxococcales bacterium]